MGGVKEGIREDILASLWAHIKEKKLKKPGKRVQIICDDLLRDVCDGKEVITTLQVTKYLSQNLTEKTSNSPAKPKSPGRPKKVPAKAKSPESPKKAPAKKPEKVEEKETQFVAAPPPR